MTERMRQVLFVCTGNSARSIIAEGLLNELGRGRFRAHSAGSQPAGAVNPLAISTLRAHGIAGAGLRSKSWGEFAAPGAPTLDFVITVCDRAAGEVCPFWPGQPMTAHWGVPDPAAVQGSPDERAHAFTVAALALKRRIELMLALPIESLDALALQRAMTDIGQR